MSDLVLTKSEKKLVLERRKKLKKGKLLRCPKDGYIWIYTGNRIYVSCPQCAYGSVHVVRHRFKE